MNVAKRFCALILALTMIFAMAITARAEGEENDEGSEGSVVKGSIQITTAAVAGSDAKTYRIYKMYTIAQVNGGQTYQVTTDWAGFEVEDLFSIENGYIIWKHNSVSASEGAVLAKKAAAHVTDAMSYVVADVGGQAVQVDGNAYYLLVAYDKDGKATGVSGVVTIIGNEAEVVVDKTAAPGRPTILKQVQEDSTSTNGDYNDVDIGQTIYYQTTITAGANASKYVVHDDMDSHIKFLGIQSITRDGNLMPTSDYIIEKNENDTDLADGCRFHVVFTDAVCSTLVEKAKIVIHYTGMLKQDAEVNVLHENKTWMTFTEEEIKSNEDSTYTQTYQVSMKKIDDKKAPLTGAGFMLRDNANKFYYWDTASGRVLWLTKKTEDGKEVWVHEESEKEYPSPTELKTSEANGCVLTFKGVDAENFYLVETTVPGGYTGATETLVSTKAEKTGMEPIPANTGNVIEITNVLGTALPETGGMGTTLFYVIGGLMAAGAAILLVTKKRMGA